MPVLTLGFGDGVSSSSAKKDYFLTTQDLLPLDYASLGGGIGIGRPSKFYREADVLEAAIKKHGPEGYKKKCEARKRRETKKRAKEAAAKAAAAQMQENQTPSSGSGSNRSL